MPRNASVAFDWSLSSSMIHLPWTMVDISKLLFQAIVKLCLLFRMRLFCGYALGCLPSKYHMLKVAEILPRTTKAPKVRRNE
ncbi:hypothetical protein SASPL_107378 [Salvia splendens]|uniref:Uncharacterized protein n=1 Tax=Salvia splendens TaxID=180675 RepID=A0A8X9A785_SALSN|nr:hypothetical protein SASPL_107378 [Salvia splendens]